MQKSIIWIPSEVFFNFNRITHSGLGNTISCQVDQNISDSYNHLWLEWDSPYQFFLKNSNKVQVLVFSFATEIDKYPSYKQMKIPEHLMCKNHLKKLIWWNSFQPYKILTLGFEIQLKCASLTCTRIRENHSTSFFIFASKFCKTLVTKW